MKFTLPLPIFAATALSMATPSFSNPSELASLCAGLAMPTHGGGASPSASLDASQSTPTPVFSTLSAVPRSSVPPGNNSLTTITHTLTLTLTAGDDTATYQPVASPSATPTHVVQVGPGGALVFDPPEIAAARGDVVRFLFVSGNHTVTQSSLEQPCVPQGFDTGFVGVDERGPQHVDYVVEGDQEWFHCRQTDHCEQGMLFAVNAGGQFEQFTANALRSN